MCYHWEQTTNVCRFRYFCCFHLRRRSAGSSFVYSCTVISTADISHRAVVDEVHSGSWISAVASGPATGVVGGLTSPACRVGPRFGPPRRPWSGVRVALTRSRTRDPARSGAVLRRSTFRIDLLWSGANQTHPKSLGDPTEKTENTREKLQASFSRLFWSAPVKLEWRNLKK